MQKVTREQRQSLLDLDKLDSARKRLQENYQEAQNGKLLSLYLILITDRQHDDMKENIVSQSVPCLKRCLLFWSWCFL